MPCPAILRCSRQFKVTNSKANHNKISSQEVKRVGVPDSSKLQIQKQITTWRYRCYLNKRCSRQFKVTNSKANHNTETLNLALPKGVPDSSKLQIQKQITTRDYIQRSRILVFPIVQSYKFKSKSQLTSALPWAQRGCSRQFKVTNSKANHNAKHIISFSCFGVPDSSKLQIQKQITT